MLRRSDGRGARAAPHERLSAATSGRDDRLWYAGYGSNTLRERLTAYLVGSGDDGRFGPHPAFAEPDVDRTTWVRSEHPLYFAGRSIRWDGAVAFLGLRPEAGTTTRLRAYLLTPAQLAHVATVENNVPDLDWDGRPDDLAIGGARRLVLPRDLEPARAKYDTVLRLDDLEGRPVLTLTTSRGDLEPGRPGEAYRAVVAEGLADSDLGGPREVAAYLDAAVARRVATPSNTCSD